MSNEKIISLTFDLEQVVNDVLAKCNIISRSIRDEAMDDIKESVLQPDAPNTRSIVCRAVTEAFGEVKVLCQRYLRQGRTIDDNSLERMAKKVAFVKEQAKNVHGRPLFRCTEDGVPHEVFQLGHSWLDAITKEAVTPDSFPEPIITDTDEIDYIEYEVVPLELYIPNFNVAVTDHLKSSIHKMVVDYIIASFLQDQLSDKAAEYKALTYGEDRKAIIRDLNARERFNFRKPAWV